jgi:stage IV sporulation protein FB
MEINNPAIPPKPALESSSKKTSVQRTIISLMIYLAIVILSGWELKFIIISTVVLFIHEMGHLLAMKYFRYGNVNMLFIPLLGALVSGEKRNVPYRHEVIVLLAGPVPGIILGMMLLAFPFDFIYGYNKEAAEIFIFLNLFNMLPLYPLDGGRIMGKLFTQGKNIVEIFFYSLSAIALLAFIYYDGLSMMAIIMIPIGFQIIRSIDIMMDRNQLKKSGFDFNKNYDELSDEEYHQLDQYLRENKPKLNDQSRLSYLEALLTHSKELKLSWKEKIIFLLIWLFFLLAPFIQLAYLAIRGSGV